ncbi:DUF1223 domain-containing protein [Aquimarina mytili]|uniref:DUF1223 domain-containing protein n=1 Tax=Aquimarina mytili TaxID=874423 RepID=A0A937D7Q5_9FLAO|nr:DUF1223 domain-containing protein [Aquimarina mytili]MBL0683320.1 DUF1223 domain-containing protein [Aquimarina mytili]
MRKKLLLLFITIISSLASGQDKNESAIVLELFTSQGCSSCPPADELLDKIRQQYQDQNVFVLSYHVDYWNRLGWKDPFSTKTFTDYQRAYGSQFKSRSIYTPQLVVNGSEHFTGSNHYKTDIALQKYAKSKSTNVIMLKNIKKKQEEIELEYGVEGDMFNTITFALVVSERITVVSRGENRNRTLKNTNIVASRKVTKGSTGNVSISIPNWITDKDELSIIGYTQDTSLKTTGASKIRI